MKFLKRAILIAVAIAALMAFVPGRAEAVGWQGDWALAQLYFTISLLVTYIQSR